MRAGMLPGPARDLEGRSILHGCNCVVVVSEVIFCKATDAERPHPVLYDSELVIPHVLIFQASMTAGSGGASSARVDEPGSGPSGEGAEGPRNMETGMQAANVVPGATTGQGCGGCCTVLQSVRLFLRGG